MTKALFTVIVIAATSVAANAVTLKASDLTVTKVTVETPLPTGLESTPGAADKHNDLYAAIKKDSRVAPFVTAAEKKYVSKAGDAAKYGNHAWVQVNCNEHPSPYGAEDKSKCALTVTKTYGWYADLALILTIEGFVNKDIAKDFE